MELDKRKNVILMCANVGCYHIATHFFKVRINNSIVRIGLCENCGFELKANVKKGEG